jgi:hypothetical protein
MAALARFGYGTEDAHNRQDRVAKTKAKLAALMAIEYTIKATCDKCGAEIEPQTSVKKGNIECARWEWQRKWKQTGIMQGLPNRYGKYKLYCRHCAGS